MGKHVDRVITLEGGRNFRDLGGYATQDGRRVKWRMLYRSGSMAGLTPDDYERLAALAIKRVHDLRTMSERIAEPNRWADSSQIKTWSRDYEVSFGDLRQVMASNAATLEGVREGMIAGYRELPYEQAPAYAALFQSLAQQNTPLVFNCSAGKDRAGTAAALVLTALGVPRETVIEDYLLTNQVLDLSSLLARITQSPDSPLAGQSIEITKAILHTNEDYIRAALNAIEARHGDISGYLEETLGLSQQALNDIRDHLLE